jgi:diguanylate cyclase (GGDEF)-like protein/PAS domain S-box-containing protein
MVISAVALLVASVVFAIYDRSTFLRAKTQDLGAAATMIGSNSTAALSFGDAKSAREVLAALQAKQNVTKAYIYDKNGRVFATYSRDAAHDDFSTPPAQAQAIAIASHNMALFQPITLNGRFIGTIFIQADLTDLSERLTRFLKIDFLVLLTSLTVAFLLSFWLQRVISDPIQELADTALSVSSQEDYSIRAAKKSDDEIGFLFDQFNRMLDRIEQRDTALQEAHSELENRVAERTSYLNALIQNSPLGIMVVDAEQNVQLCNSAFEKLFNCSQREVVEKSIVSVFGDVEPLLVAHRLALDETPINLTARLQRKDQTVLDVELHAVGLMVDGKLVGSLGLYQDISVRTRAVEEMKKMEHKLRGLAAIVESSDDAIISKALDGTIQTWNGGAERMYEYSAVEAIGKPISIIFPDEEWNEIPAILERVKQDETVKHFETVRVKKDGKRIHIDITISPVNDALGRIVGASTIARDITERVKAEERLRLWSGVLEQSGEGIFICDPQEHILLVNTAFEKLTGFLADEAVGKTRGVLQTEPQDRAFDTDMWKSVSETGAWQGEMWNHRKSGELYAEWLSISAISDHKGVVTHYIGIFSDITARKQAAERMVHLAHYDALTDLPNRVLLMDRLSQLTKAAQRKKSKVAAVFIDLDRFKEVNDSLGHDAGDLLLQTLAKRFSNVVRNEDTLARLGGDEFVMVIQGLHQSQDVAIIAKQLLSCLVKPVTLNGYEITVTASMGISVYPDDATDGQELIRNADAAMYQAKGAGRNAFQFYTSDLNQRALEMLSTENALRRAIERQELVLHYQPQVDIASGSVVGAEALIRWNHPDLGVVMPGKFISIAEERGLIVSIGSWVIEEAARQAAVWQSAGIFITIAVNVSAVQFRQKDFEEQLSNTVRNHGITANLLELELTESIVMRDAETAVDKLKKLHDMGFRLSIDDFGTGYSSLNYLRRFPIDKIKIDQSFVKDQSAGSIVTAIISLARNLKLKVIAEGVETKEQLELLREQGCNEAQGFLFSPALAVGEFEKLVREWNPKYLESQGVCPAAALGVPLLRP